MFVCCECCVLSGRGLCDGLITRPEESYRLGCVVVCDLETSRMRRPWPALGRSATGRKKIWKVVLLMFQDTVTMYSGPTNLTLKIKAARFSESAKGLRYDAFVYCRNTDRQTDGSETRRFQFPRQKSAFLAICSVDVNVFRYTGCTQTVFRYTGCTQTVFRHTGCTQTVFRYTGCTQTVFRYTVYTNCI